MGEIGGTTVDDGPGTDLQNILRQSYDNAKVTIDVSFTKHPTKDARLFSGTIHLQNRLR